MSRLEVKERFPRDVAGHVMTIEQDDGVFRAIRFGRPGSSSYYFRLITWPGSLCIDGDMGTFVFSRLRDMFGFFREGDGRGDINPGYWSGKLVSVNGGRYGGKCMEYDADKFQAWVKNRLVRMMRSGISLIEAQGLRREVEEELLNRGFDDEKNAATALYCFRWQMRDHEPHDFGYEFPDFTEYSFHFLWCLHAIVWGIQQYDAARPAPAEAGVTDQTVTATGDAA